MGRNPQTKELTFKVGNDFKKFEVETFTWEKLDYIDKVKTAFKL